MSTVTLCWEDPEDSGDFLRLREALRRDGWLPDPSRDALLELIGESDVVADDGGEGLTDDD